MSWVFLTSFATVTLTGRSISSYRSLSESGENSELPSSQIPPLERWWRDWQTHEQFVIGRSTKRSVAKMKAFLDGIEEKIEGHQKTKDRAPEENKSSMRTKLLSDEQPRK